MDELSVFGVRATSGSLREQAAPDHVVLAHVWSEEGVVAGPATNGAQLLHLSVAMCVLNDTYREAQRLGVAVSGVAVTADGDFDPSWASTGISYTLDVASPAPPDDVRRVVDAVDAVAEIPRVLRAGTVVARR